MQTFNADHGIAISYEKHGSGPALVLVHGGFSDHRSNWEFVLPYFQQHFTVYAIARRNRGETSATRGHSLPDECMDTVALIHRLGEPVYLLGHSYGAHVGLIAAAAVPDRVRKLVVYEAPWPHLLNPVMGALTRLAGAGDWDAFSFTFFRDGLNVPIDVLDELRATPHLWAPIVEDAPATLSDILALQNYDFRPERYTNLQIPVQVQVGTESPRSHYVTDALLQVLPDARIAALEGQAHEGMTTAPEQYADEVVRFLIGEQRQTQAHQH